MAKQKIYVSKANLVYYDEKLKAWVVNQDLATLTAAKNYADGKDTAIAEAKAAADAAQETANSGVSKADAAQAGVDSINSKIGTVEDGKTVMGIIQNIQENAYDDTEIQAKVSKNTEDIAGLDTRLTAEEGKVSTLIGDDAGKSVRAITLEEVAKILNDNDSSDIDTLEEITAWIKDHPESVAEINARIDQNKTAIDALSALVGEMPEGEASATIVAYIQKLVSAEETRAKGVEEGLAQRLTTVEGLVGTTEDGKTVSEQISEAVAGVQSQLDELSEEVDTKASTETVTAIDGRVTAVEGKVSTLETKMSTAETDIDNLEKSLAVGGATATAISTAQSAAEAAQKTADEAKANAATNATAISTLDGKMATAEGKIATLESASHSHDNKALLDTYTQTEANLADAVAKKHEHANATELNKIADGDVAKWNASEQNAKDYADGLNTAMNTRVEALESVTYVELATAEIDAMFA